MLPKKILANSACKVCSFFYIGFFIIYTASAQTGVTWTSRTSAADNSWTSVCFGKGLFVAVAFTGTGNRVMTSPDGITWTARTSAADNGWLSVAYGNGIFVAVASTGTNRVMTSTDGINWTARLSANEGNQWTSVTYGNGLFVAVAQSGVGNRVMTSPDGINWTIRSSAADNSWVGVTYGNGLYVAVGVSGVGNRVMTSPDGITWTARSTTSDGWYAVTYANSLFVAVAISGTNWVMTSPDGINWTTRTPAAANSWRGITYANSLFVAVSSTGTGDRVMTSPNGITWTSRTSAADNFWRCVVYAGGMFVAVGQTGTGNRVMTSGTFSTLPVTWISFAGDRVNGKNELRWETANEVDNVKFIVERSVDRITFTNIGEVGADRSPASSHQYSFVDSSPLSGDNYYRLKQVDRDGRFEYSRVLKISNSNQPEWSIYPNPATDRITISGLTSRVASYKYTITNQSGQIVANGSIDAAGTINVAQLAKGIYQISIEGLSRKLVKQ